VQVRGLHPEEARGARGNAPPATGAGEAPRPRAEAEERVKIGPVRSRARPLHAFVEACFHPKCYVQSVCPTMPRK
jgi:hypothetical protein